MLKKRSVRSPRPFKDARAEQKPVGPRAPTRRLLRSSNRPQLLQGCKTAPIGMSWDSRLGLGAAVTAVPTWPTRGCTRLATKQSAKTRITELSTQPISKIAIRLPEQVLYRNWDFPRVFLSYISQGSRQPGRHSGVRQSCAALEMEAPRRAALNAPQTLPFLLFLSLRPFALFIFLVLLGVRNYEYSVVPFPGCFKDSHHLRRNPSPLAFGQLPWP